MKKGLLLTTLLGSAVLAGCCSNTNMNCDCGNEDAVLNQRTEYCLDNGGTHSLIHSQTAVYGECAFPSGITCEDDILGTDECDFLPHLENIDTQEKRIAGCEENAKDWIKDFVDDAEYLGVEWSDEVEESTDLNGDITLIKRAFNVKYAKDGKEWILPSECEANFQDGSLGASYGEEYEAE